MPRKQCSSPDSTRALAAWPSVRSTVLGEAQDLALPLALWMQQENGHFKEKGHFHL